MYRGNRMNTTRVSAIILLIFTLVLPQQISPAGISKKTAIVVVFDFSTENVTHDDMTRYIDSLIEDVQVSLNDSGNNHIILKKNDELSDTATQISSAKTDVICLIGGKIAFSDSGYRVTVLIEDLSLKSHADLHSFHYPDFENLDHNNRDLVDHLTSRILGVYSARQNEIKAAKAANINPEHSITHSAQFITVQKKYDDSYHGYYPSAGLSYTYFSRRDRIFYSIKTWYAVRAYPNPTLTMIGTDLICSVSALLPFGLSGLIVYDGCDMDPESASVFLGFTLGLLHIPPNTDIWNLVSNNNHWKIGFELLRFSFYGSTIEDRYFRMVNWLNLSIGYTF